MKRHCGNYLKTSWLADLVVLNKTDLVDAQTQAQVVDLIQQELPRVVKMVPSDRGQLDQLLFGFQAAVEEDLAAVPAIMTPKKTTSTTKRLTQPT